MAFSTSVPISPDPRAKASSNLNPAFRCSARVMALKSLNKLTRPSILHSNYGLSFLQFAAGLQLVFRIEEIKAFPLLMSVLRLQALITLRILLTGLLSAGKLTRHCLCVRTHSTGFCSIGWVRQAQALWVRDRSLPVPRISLGVRKANFWVYPWLSNL